jgi:heme/copper-type cytochrome/quinol oxidase subunit 4
VRTPILIPGSAHRASKSNAMTWLIGFGFAAVLAAIAVMYARMRTQAAPSAMHG